MQTTTPEKAEQVSLLDLLGSIGNISDGYSSEDIEKAINKLIEAKHFAKKREKVEQERAEQEEKKRIAREEKERHDAHVQEVTCMDLPMDWENVFNEDTGKARAPVCLTPRYFGSRRGSLLLKVLLTL